MRSKEPRTRPFHIPETIYGLVERMFVWGAAAFVIGLVYVGWGLFTGRLDDALRLPPPERFKVTQNVLFACKIMAWGGIASLIGAAARFYYEETIGYIYMIVGAALYWGVAALAGPTISQMHLEVGKIAVLALRQLQQIGMVALALAVPFIIADFWARLRGARRFEISRPADAAGGAQCSKSNAYLFCWQMPYCRDYLRQVCAAYEQKKPCWRIKTGCYCDENMILKVLQRSKTSKLPGFDQKYSKPGIGLGQNLTAAQKRARCRQCFLYAEHQKRKYRILSPLVFPVVIGLMWYYIQPLKALLGRVLAFTDQFAGSVTFGPRPDQVTHNPWLDLQATSGIVEWLFVICVGLIVLSYVLRALEYAIFEMQI